MKYIPDKQLYKAVMFALKMCPDLNHALDSKVKLAADYYKVNGDDVFKFVKDELWRRKIAELSDGRWKTVWNPEANRLVGGFGDFVIVCPVCGSQQRAPVNSFSVDKIFVSACPSCGFVDRFQRHQIRKDVFDLITKREAAVNG